MANTYTQLHIHIVFAVRYRLALIHPSWKHELHKFITGSIQKNGHKVLQINSVADHIHILVGLNPAQSISAMIQVAKAESAKWINQRKFCKQTFAWQSGYGAFSFTKNEVETVIRYIQNQETHHKTVRLQEEYKGMLIESGVLFEEKYLFHEPQDIAEA